MSRRATTPSLDSSGEARRRRWGRRRRSRNGQALVIFALSFTVLLGLAGLTIDVARAYDLYARMQRAAEAGALAGVLYMPAYYNSVRPNDVDSAVSRASKEIVMDGFGTALAPTDNACVPGAPVSICPITGRSDDLQVTVTQTLDLVLLSGLGVQPVTLSASASAEYLPPAQIGARLNYYGDQVECFDNANNPDPTKTDPCNVGNPAALQSYLGVFNGPDELKENGDPFVYCEEGPAYAQPDTTQNYTAYNGDVTNHPQYTDSILNHCGQPTSTEPGNPDQQPAGFDGEMTKSTSHPGGYNFLLNVPQGGGDATLWVFNPSFIPSNSGGPLSSFDHFNGGSTNYFVGPNGTGIRTFNGNYDAPPFFYNITYSLYNVASVFDRTTDTLADPPISYPPYDDMPNIGQHGCTSGQQVYDPYWDGSVTPNSYNPPIVSGSGCVTLSPSTAAQNYSPTSWTPPSWNPSAPNPCWQAWCPVYLSLAPGTYRLAIEATGLTSQTANYTSGLTSGYGPHMYALKLCPAIDATPISCSDGATANSPGLQLAAWNNMDVYFTSGLSTSPPTASDPSRTCTTQASPATPYTCLDVACLPTSYAGRTLSVQIFDPGDGSGDIYVGVAQAGGGTADVTYPGLPSANIVTIDGDSVVQARFTSPASYNAFNGIWLTAAVTLPADYTGDCTGGTSSTGWWQMIYASADGTPSDVVGMKLSLTGSPVHLLTLLD